MKDLWKSTKWRYHIDLTGQEFPLKTNNEIVHILKSLSGANALEGSIKRFVIILIIRYLTPSYGKCKLL